MLELIILIAIVLLIVKKIVTPWTEDMAYMNSLKGENDKKKSLDESISEHTASGFWSKK